MTAGEQPTPDPAPRPPWYRKKRWTLPLGAVAAVSFATLLTRAETPSQVLTLAGGALQIMGILLAVGQLLRSRDVALEYERAHGDYVPEGSVLSVTTSRTRMLVSPSDALALTVEERLQRLEQQAEILEDLVHEGDASTAQVALRLAQGEAFHAQLKSGTRLHLLTRFVRDLTDGGVRAYASLGLLLVGVAMQAVAVLAPTSA